MNVFFSAKEVNVQAEVGHPWPRAQPLLLNYISSAHTITEEKEFLRCASEYRRSGDL